MDLKQAFADGAQNGAQTVSQEHTNIARIAPLLDEICQTIRDSGLFTNVELLQPNSFRYQLAVTTPAGGETKVNFVLGGGYHSTFNITDDYRYRGPYEQRVLQKPEDRKAIASALVSQAAYNLQVDRLGYRPGPRPEGGKLI